MNKNFKKNAIAAAMFIAFTVPSVQALEINAVVKGTLNGASFNDVDGPQASGSVDVLDGQYSNASNVFYHTYGDDAGNFGSRVSGNGIYDLTGTFSYKDTITNDSGAAQAYNFDFKVIAGELALYGAPSAGENTHAEYDLDILVNGSSVWNSNAAVNNIAGTSSFSESGTSINGTRSGDTYRWSEFLDSIDLGVFDNNESFDFEYVLASHASGNCFTSTVPVYPEVRLAVNGGEGGDTINDDEGVEGGEGGEGGEGVEGGEGGEGGEGVEGGEGGGQCGSVARIGDPFNFRGSPTNSGNITTSSVPAPGGLALLGLGLAGVAATRRRKNKAK